MTVTVTLGSMLWISSVRTAMDGFFGFLRSRLTEAQREIQSADVVVQVVHDEQGLVTVSGYAPGTARRARSVAELSSILPNSPVIPRAAIVLSYQGGQGAMPNVDPPEVKSAIQRVRYVLGQRGAVLPRAGYTIRVQRKP